MRRFSEQAVSRRAVLQGGAAVACLAVLPTRSKAQSAEVLNDASGLNPTPVHRHWIVAPHVEAETIARLRVELKVAASEGRPVALGCARHSMGGQTLARDGLALSFDGVRCDADSAGRTYRAWSGMRWRDVIATLDPLGFSPAVMQSNNDFGIGGTLSVNAHGWPVPYGPFGSTVRAFRLMLADGSVVTCSRTENPELFSLVIGGYGLFGIILDVQLDMADNELLEPTFEVVPSSAFGARFVDVLTADTSVRMAYGRLSIDREDFLKEALLGTFRPVADQPDVLPGAAGYGAMTAISRRIFRAQIGSETFKNARWFAETVMSPIALSGNVTRNSLLHEPVSSFGHDDETRTDIIHEYFVAPERFADFITACQKIIPQSASELLNVTLRYVAEDETSLLRYAPSRRIAAVMLFSQKKTAAADEDMRRMTQALIDRVLDIGGSFYLPYRLHARIDQVEAAYPVLSRFVQAKLEYDPGRLFRHTMWDTYIGGLRR